MSSHSQYENQTPAGLWEPQIGIWKLEVRLILCFRVPFVFASGVTPFSLPLSSRSFYALPYVSINESSKNRHTPQRRGACRLGGCSLHTTHPTYLRKLRNDILPSSQALSKPALDLNVVHARITRIHYDIIPLILLDLLGDVEKIKAGQGRI